MIKRKKIQFKQNNRHSYPLTLFNTNRISVLDKHHLMEELKRLVLNGRLDKHEIKKINKIKKRYFICFNYHESIFYQYLNANIHPNKKNYDEKLIFLVDMNKKILQSDDKSRMLFLCESFKSSPTLFALYSEDSFGARPNIPANPRYENTYLSEPISQRKYDSNFFSYRIFSDLQSKKKSILSARDIELSFLDPTEERILKINKDDDFILLENAISYKNKIIREPYFQHDFIQSTRINNLLGMAIRGSIDPSILKKPGIFDWKDEFWNEFCKLIPDDKISVEISVTGAINNEPISTYVNNIGISLQMKMHIEDWCHYLDNNLTSWAYDRIEHEWKYSDEDFDYELNMIRCLSYENYLYILKVVKGDWKKKPLRGLIKSLRAYCKIIASEFDSLSELRKRVCLFFVSEHFSLLSSLAYLKDEISANEFYSYNNLNHEVVNDHLPANSKLRKIYSSEKQKHTIMMNEVDQFLKKFDPYEGLRSLLELDESEKLEFKSTYRYSLAKKNIDKEITHMVLKTLAGFMNTQGGKLVIGVADNKDIIGIEKDGYKNDDKFLLAMQETFNKVFGKHRAVNLKIELKKYNTKTICIIECPQVDDHVVIDHFKDGRQKSIYYIRTGPETVKLNIEEVIKRVQG